MSGDFTFLKGNIETIILCSLYNRDKYGYEIAKDIKDRTENAYEIKQPTLYSYLKRLQDDGLIESYWGTESNGGRRRYYMLTKYGRQNCVKFISEWEFQRGVLSNLVDGTAEVDADVTQENVTPMFGRRSQRRKTNAVDEALQHQNDISSMLDRLDGGNKPTETTTADDTQQATLEETPAPVAEETPVATEPVVQQVVQPVTTETVTETVATYAEEPPVDEGNPIPPQTSVEDVRSRFEIHQDDSEAFIHGFDRLAREASERQGTQTNNNENYQHVLMGVLGNQLDEAVTVQHHQDFSDMDVVGRPVQIEQVADTLAQEGIRLRIYNHATATYKPKTLMPVSKVLCQAGWLTYLVVAVYFGILIALSVKSGTWLPFVVTLSVITVAPIVLSIIAFVDNARKDKPDFAYRLIQIVTLIAAFIVLLVALSISLFNNIQLGKFSEVATRILIPLGVGLIPALFVWIYNYFYKKY